MLPTSEHLDPDFLRPIAHRGLHQGQRGIVENSLPAFEAAVAHGFGIECDLRAACDGTPVVFHDATLERLTSAAGAVGECSAEALQAVPLAHCRHRSTIPTLSDLLRVVAGRVPLMVEVKSEWRTPGARFIAGISGALSGYRGPVALMSFDPAVVGALALAAPSIPRGLVSGSCRHADDGTPWWPHALDDARRARLSELTGFDAVGASFIAYEAAALPRPAVSVLRAAGTPVFAWTVRSADEWATATPHADAPIFEGDWL